MNNFKINIFKTEISTEVLPTFREWHFSTPGRATSSLACNDTTFTNTWYTAYQVGTLPTLGSTLYNESGLTTTVSGGNLWYNSQEAFILGPTSTTYQIGGSGTLDNSAVCPLTDSVLLGYSTISGPDACSDFSITPVTRYTPTGDAFLIATVLYQNAEGTIPAQAGYYSDGAKWRYWDEVSFTSEDFC